MRKVVILLMVVVSAGVLCAKPAYRGPIERTQPDGSTITVYLHGDEFFHWETNAAGEWLTQDAEGKYVPTSALTEEAISHRRKASPLYMPQAVQQASPRNLAPRGLIILVNFQDVAFQSTNTLAILRDMHNADNYSYSYSYTDPDTHKTVNITAEGSVRKYFMDQSGGQYQPTFDVVGPYTVSENMAYYGENKGGAGTDKRPHYMVKEACELADKDGVDFSLYDNDKNGKVDFVYVLYAGYCEADGAPTTTIWPHSWQLYSGGGITLTLDGKKVDLYACSSELNYVSNARCGIGTFCHEFSHVLGLPDIYPANGGNHKTSGCWEVMDYGPYNNDGNTPPAYSGYERLFFGWATSRVLSTYGEVSIKELQAFNDVCVITPTGAFNGQGNDPYPTEFYVLENRQQKGWDGYIPGHGLMLTKINYSHGVWSGNTVNNNSGNLCVDLIEADGLTPSYTQYNRENGYFGKQTDLFPAGATEYVKIPNYGITNITEANEEISFSLGYSSDIGATSEDGLNGTRSQGVWMKRLENGQVVIVRDGVKYSLLGEKL